MSTMGGDPYSAGIGAAIGLGGTLLGSLGGGAKARNNEIAPGLSKYTADQMSREARGRGQEALTQYLAALQGMAGRAQGQGQAMLGAFQSGASALRGEAGRATGEVAGVYKDFGKRAGASAYQNYADLLKSIGANQAISRARSGGVNTGQDMVAAGARTQAAHGLNDSLASIEDERSRLLGGALERGRGRELALGQDLLGGEMNARQQAYSLPEQYRKMAADAGFNTSMSDLFLYPTQNLRLKIGGVSRNPGATDAAQQIGGNLAGVGGYLFGNSLDRYLNAPPAVTPGDSSYSGYIPGYTNRPH